MVLFALEVVLHVPVTLSVSGRNFLHLTAIYISAALPFFLTGVQFSVVFARESRRIPRLYAADLGGGALACLAVVPLLNWVGGPNTIVASAAVMAAAAVSGPNLYRRAPRSWWRGGCIPIVDRGETTRTG